MLLIGCQVIPVYFRKELYSRESKKINKRFVGAIVWAGTMFNLFLGVSLFNRILLPANHVT